jgi:DNA primase
MTDARTRIDVDEIKRRASIQDAVTAFCPGIQLTRQGRELVALSPFKAERTPSFTIDTQRNVFFCFATDQGGDAIRFVELLQGIPFAEAARRLAEVVIGGVPVEQMSAAETKAKAEARQREREEIEGRERAEQLDRIGYAERIWMQTIVGAGSLVEAYLAWRGVDLAALARVYGRRVPISLRCHMQLRAGKGDPHVGPAMVGSFVNAAGDFCGVHRTFLATDGMGKAAVPKAKLALGQAYGSFGVLSPLDQSDRAVIGEGYETTLTAMAALARRGERVVGLSGLTLGNLAGAGLGHGRPHPLMKGKRLPSEVPDPSRPGLVLPSHIKRVTILEDADGKDPIASRARIVRAVAKFRAAGLKVAVATPASGCDFNDMIGRAA